MTSSHVAVLLTPDSTASFKLRQAPPQSSSSSCSLRGLHDFCISSDMTRGNQREQDRAKAQKKAASQKKPKESASTLAKRREDDATALREKQKKKEEEKSKAGASGGTAKK